MDSKSGQNTKNTIRLGFEKCSGLIKTTTFVKMILLRKPLKPAKLPVFLAITFLGVLILLSGCRIGTTEEDRVELVSTHPSFLTRQELNIILAERAERTVKPAIAESRVISAVIPHHLVASRLLNDALEVLSRQETDRIILVGPNHFNKGSRIISGLYGWETPEGVVQADEKAIRRLLEQGLAVRDENVLEKEHSIGALVPLIKHYLPKAKVVPLILHHDVSLQEIDVLLRELEPFLDEKSVLIASVDFSHYLTRREAQAKDQETLNYMQAFDYQNLYRLGNDYLDSPASLAAAFRLAEKQGLKEFTVLDNTNSGLILQNDFIETTSYFTLIFR